MSTQLCIKCSYSDNNEKKDYSIYYNSKDKTFRDFTKHGGYIDWINVKENNELIIHYSISNEKGNIKILKNVEKIKIKEKFKELIGKRGLISISGKNLFNIDVIANSRNIKENHPNDINNKIKKINNIIRTHSMIDSNVLEKYDFLSNIQISIDNILDFILKYSIYLNINKTNLEEIEKEDVFNFLCIGIIVSRNEDFFTNSRQLFEAKPAVVRKIINCLKYRSIDEIIIVSNNIFNDTDVNTILDNLTYEEINSKMENIIIENTDTSKKIKKMLKIC